MSTTNFTNYASTSSYPQLTPLPRNFQAIPAGRYPLYFNPKTIEQICLNRVYNEVRSNWGKITDSFVTMIKVIISTIDYFFEGEDFSTRKINCEIKKEALEKHIVEKHSINKYFQHAANIPYERQPECVKKFLVNPAKAISKGINPTSPLPQIENATWYIDWTSWSAPIPSGVNTVNIFVGAIQESNGTYTLGNFGTFTPDALKTFVQSCHQQGIAVKVSIGGGGGQNCNCWDLLTETNIQDVAQGMVTFCHQYGLDGVDFDYEEFKSPAQEQLVGELIKNVKAIDSTLQTSLCCNAAFSSWSSTVKTIFDSAMNHNKCAIDRLYIMSYYQSLDQEMQWISQWHNWLQQNYGYTPAQVTAGIDNFDSVTYDVKQFAEATKKEGYSTSYWAWNPADPSTSNSKTETIWNVYHP